MNLKQKKYGQYLNTSTARRSTFNSLFYSRDLLYNTNEAGADMSGRLRQDVSI